MQLLPFLSAIFGNLLLQKTTVMMMTGLHGKKGLNSLKMPVFRSLSPGQHKLYPSVPKNRSHKKSPGSQYFQGFYGGGHGT